VADQRESVDSPNRTLLYVIGTLIVLFLIGGLVVGSKKKPATPVPPANARAVVVPTDDAARTIVVSPCRTAVAETTRDVERGVSTPNTVRVRLPRGSGDRAVLVPHCSPQSGGVSQGLPSAAFVLPVGSRSKQLLVPPVRAEAQLIVPTGGEARTVVVPPCTGQLGGQAGKPAPAAVGGRRQDVVLAPQNARSTVATAPQC
jgi:hypothetical protein